MADNRQERERRLAEALRQNLKRRREQKKAVTQGDDGEKPGERDAASIRRFRDKSVDPRK
ncbi:MAG: hypothetical protein AAGE61_19380 [Pseudomonadota bacterium]